MEGPHDDKLQRSGHWPIKGKLLVQLLNHNSIYHSFRDTYRFTEYFHQSTIVIKDIHRVTRNDVVKIGSIDFVAHSTITSETSQTDLYFRVQYDVNQISDKDIYTLSEQLNDHKLSLQLALIPLHLSQSNRQGDDQVAPDILQLSRFSAMVVGDTWYSSPFFAFIGGYQVCLKVVRVKDCLISLEIFLMKGPHDEKLQKLGLWPMKGTFTIKLFGNSIYYPHVYTLSDDEKCTKCFEQVITNDMANEGFGFSLVSLDSSCTEPNFFKDDALFFEVLYSKGTALYV